MGYSPAAQNASIKFPMGVTTDGSGLIWIKDTIIHILNRICIHISFILILVETTLKITEQLFSVFGLVFWRFGGILSFCCCSWYEIESKSMTTKNIVRSYNVFTGLSFWCLGKVCKCKWRFKERGAMAVPVESSE